MTATPDVADCFRDHIEAFPRRATWQTVLISVAVASLTGCAGVQPREGFADVQPLVSERTAKHVAWYSAGPEDRAVAEQLTSLLAEALDADAAAQIALLNNRHLQATYEQLGIAQADLVQAGLLKNPVFSGDLKFPEGGGGTNVELGVAMDFLDVLYIPMRKSIAETALEGAKLRVTIAVMDVASEARTTFYALQAAEQILEMRETVLAASDASYELAKRINEAGNNTKLDLANERAMYEESKLNLAAAEAEASDLREHLTGLLGLWGNQTQFRTKSRLPELPAEELASQGLERRAIAQSLDLKLARSEITAAAKQLGVTKPLGVLSELEVGAVAERESEGGWSAGPSVSLPIPLFSQGQPAVATAEARLRQAQQSYFALAVDIRSGIRSAYKHMITARQRAEYYRNVVIPLRHSIVEESQKQYNAMQIGAFQLLEAKRDEVEAGREYVEALREYWLARAELDEILAGRFVRSERPLFTPELEIKRPGNAGGH
jgi:cobalt-zinc-cadmium efflux system outer membrane protein